MNLHHLQYRKRIPPAVANVVADRKSTDLSVGSEKVLMDFLVAGFIFRSFSHSLYSFSIFCTLILLVPRSASPWTSFQVSREQDVS